MTFKTACFKAWPDNSSTTENGARSNVALPNSALGQQFWLHPVIASTPWTRPRLSFAHLLTADLVSVDYCAGAEAG